LEAALAVRRGALGDAHPLTLRAWTLLADATHRRGRPAAARRDLRRCLRLLAAPPLGPHHHPAAAAALVVLGETQLTLADYPAARDTFYRAARGLRGHADADAAPSPTLARAVHGLARVLALGEGRAGDALTVHTYVLGARLRALDERHPDVARSVAALAEAHRDLGDLQVRLLHHCYAPF